MKSRRPTLETLSARLPFAMDVMEVEPNNTAAQATRFEWTGDDAVHLKGTSQSKDDKDFFVFRAAKTGTIHVSVQASASASLEVESGGINIFETEPKDGINSGRFSVQAGQNYFIRLRSVEKSSSSYDANLSFAASTGTTDGTTGGSSGGSTGGNSNSGGTTGTPSVITELEPNDKASQTVSVPLTVNSTLTLAGATTKRDRDYFVLTPSSAGRITLDAGNANVKVSVETPAGQKLLETEPNDEIRSGSFSVKSGEPILVRVRGNDTSVINYGVSLTLAENPAGTTTTSTSLPSRVSTPMAWLDVSDDKLVSPLDALLVVEQLTKSRNRGGQEDNSVAFDLNDDRLLSPIDVLLVVDHLSRRGRSDVPDSSPMANGNVTVANGANNSVATSQLLYAVGGRAKAVGVFASDTDSDWFDLYLDPAGPSGTFQVAMSSRVGTPAGSFAINSPAGQLLASSNGGAGKVSVSLEAGKHYQLKISSLVNQGGQKYEFELEPLA